MYNNNSYGNYIKEVFKMNKTIHEVAPIDKEKERLKFIINDCDRMRQEYLSMAKTLNKYIKELKRQ